MNIEFELDIPTQRVINGNVKKPDLIKSIDDVDNVRAYYANKQMEGYHILYRGHADKNWTLEPSICRNGLDYSIEREIYEDFKNYAQKQNWSQYKLSCIDEDLFYMSIGRHLGLPCRLLDWSASIETALCMATEKKKIRW